MTVAVLGEPRQNRRMKRTIVIGDVHGCLDELRDLLREVGATPADRLVLAGDLVVKGPDSRGVLRLVRKLGAASVLGNHEDKLLRARRQGTTLSGAHREVAESLDDDDWRWLESMPLRIDLPDIGIVVVHAGLIPGVPLDRQRRENLLSLRSLRADGTPSRRVDDGEPWASRWPGPQKVVFGHDALRGLQRHRFATGLDTGCVYGGVLTALVEPGSLLVSVPARRQWAQPGDLEEDGGRQ